MIRAWLARRAERKVREGYAWAAGELLSVRMSPAEVEAQCFRPFDDKLEFDFGAMDAVLDWIARTTGEVET